MSGCQRVEHEANVMVGGDRSILTRMAISVRSMAIWPLSSSKRRRNRNGAFCLKNSKMADNAMLAMLLCTLLRRASRRRDGKQGSFRPRRVDPIAVNP